MTVVTIEAHFLLFKMVLSSKPVNLIPKRDFIKPYNSFNKQQYKFITYSDTYKTDMILGGIHTLFCILRNIFVKTNI